MNVDNGEIQQISEILIKLTDKELLEKVRLTPLNKREREAIKNIKPATDRPEELAWMRWAPSSVGEISHKDAFLAGFKAAKDWA